MKSFNVGEKPKVSLKKAVSNVAVKFAIINEDFAVGTNNGIEYGNAGDYLVVNSDGNMSVSSKYDFYEKFKVAAPKAKKVAKKPKAATKKTTPKRTLKANPKVTPAIKKKAKRAVASNMHNEVYRFGLKVKKTVKK